MAAAVCSPPGACSMNHISVPEEHPHVESDFFASTHPVEVSQELPTKNELLNVAYYPLFTENGAEVPFHSLWRAEDHPRRALVIFVRHFFCGNCQEYLRTISQAISAWDLHNLSTPTSISVVGCGQPDLIPFYREATNCPFPMYADPTRELYVKLGMARTMAPGDRKPDYVRKSMFGIVTSSFAQGVTAGRNALKGGDFWQVGGEFLIENGVPTRGHRMTTTRDHVEVPTLKEWLGLESQHSDEKEEEGDDDDERAQKKRRRNLISEMGASVRRSISVRRRSPSAGKSSRKPSDSSIMAKVEE